MRTLVFGPGTSIDRISGIFASESTTRYSGVSSLPSNLGGPARGAQLRKQTQRYGRVALVETADIDALVARHDTTPVMANGTLISSAPAI